MPVEHALQPFAGTLAHNVVLPKTSLRQDLSVSMILVVAGFASVLLWVTFSIFLCLGQRSHQRGYLSKIGFWNHHIFSYASRLEKIFRDGRAISKEIEASGEWGAGALQGGIGLCAPT